MKSQSIEHSITGGRINLKFDSDGNLLANVRHRTATYATLSTLTSAGVGEIAIASDRDILFVYEDDGLGNDTTIGVPYSNSGFILHGLADVDTGVAIPTETGIPLKSANAIANVPNSVNSANNYIDVSGLVIDSTSFSMLTVNFGLSISGFDANTNIILSLQRSIDGVTWVDLNNPAGNVTLTTDGAGALVFREQLISILNNVVLNQMNMFRVEFVHNSTTDGAIIGFSQSDPMYFSIASDRSR